LHLLVGADNILATVGFVMQEARAQHLLLAEAVLIAVDTFVV
jgi:hypothetical protein